MNIRFQRAVSQPGDIDSDGNMNTRLLRAVSGQCTHFAQTNVVGYPQFLN
jgi:hypothetical protein